MLAIAVSDDNTSIGPPPRRPAPRQVAPPKVRTGVTVPPGGGLRPVPGTEDLALGAMMPAVLVPPPMPRSAASAEARAQERPTSATRADAPQAFAPGTFGGPMATPTAMDGTGGAMPGPDPRDTGDAPQLGSEVGTHGAYVARRPVPAAALFLAPALLVGLGGSGLVWALTPGPAAPSDTPAPAVHESAAIEPELLWVAQVNEVDPARVLPFAARHERLEQLASRPEAAFVDRRLNLAFDLVQATDAPDPCATFATALDALAAAPDPSLATALSTARAPTGDAPACAGLDARRQALLATLSDPPAGAAAVAADPIEPARALELKSPFDDAAGTPPGSPAKAEAQPTPQDAEDDDAPASEIKPMPKRPAAGKPKPAAKPGPATTTPKDPPPVGRVEEELRPFGQ